MKIIKYLISIIAFLSLTGFSCYFIHERDNTADPGSNNYINGQTYYDSNTNFYWKKCSQGQNDDSSCSGTAGTYQYCDQNDYSCNSNVTWLLDGTGNSQVWDTCNSLNTNQYARRTGWRAPDIDELEDFYWNIYSDYPELFPGTMDGGTDRYWSSTADLNFTGYAFYINFGNGTKIYDLNTGSFFVRCVSGP